MLFHSTYEFHNIPGKDKHFLELLLLRRIYALDISSKPSSFRSTYCCPYTNLRDFVAVAKLPCLVYSGFVAALEFEGAVTGVCADTFENHVCQYDELPGLEAFQEGRL